MHWTYPIPARILGWHNLYTVHDVSPIDAAGTTAVDGAALHARLRAIARVATRLVTVSQFSRRRIARALDLADVAIVDAGAAVVDIAAARTALPRGLSDGGYYLFCGIDEPRKNRDRIVAGWRVSGSGRALVIVGGGAGAGGLDDGLIVLPHQPRAALMRLMAGARALLFATLEEGFGLPIVEAMALGTAVLTADHGGACETAGDAAMLVDPHDVSAIADAIGRLDRDDALLATLIARGHERAQCFTPRRFAHRLQRLYDEIAGDSARAG